MKKILFLCFCLFSCGSESYSPVEDCYNLISWMIEKIEKCGSTNTANHLEKRMIAVWSCEDAVETVDRQYLYGKCRSDIRDWPCLDIVLLSLPETCRGKFRDY